MADILRGGIAINEILVDPNGANNFDTDGNGTAAATDEFVELVNVSGVSIDISGLELWDLGNGNWFTFPPGSVLAPGAHAMVITGVQAGGALPTGGPGDLFFDAGRGSALINNGGDNVVVYDPGADQYIAATFNGDPLDNPPVDYAGFSPTATISGAGESFGPDQDGFSIQRAPDGSSVFVNNVTPTPGTQNICFTGGTLFDTARGQVAIERLRPGDLLQTRDNGLQPLRWVWARRQRVADLVREPKLRPVLIRRGALGQGVPSRDLLVSRQHRVLVSSRVAERMFGAREILVPAKDLLDLPGVSVAPVGGPVTYYHLLMDRHEVLQANGTPAESLYPGAETARALSDEAREELRLVFGVDWDGFVTRPAQPARPLEKGRRVRHLVERHMRNGIAITAH